MCGRFNVGDTPGLQRLAGALGLALAPPPARFNIAPTDEAPLLREGEAALARWWLTPSWAPRVDQKYAMFNARCEGLGRSRAFRVPFRRQRGIVPMSSFIEWRREGGAKVPWRVTNEERALAAAALWDIWRGGETPLLSCTIVTTAAAPAFRPWHDRMPVLLAGEELERWLDNEAAIAEDDPLFRPVLKFPLELAPLATGVNDARNKDPALMTPLEAAQILEP